MTETRRNQGSMVWRPWDNWRNECVIDLSSAQSAALWLSYFLQNKIKSPTWKLVLHIMGHPAERYYSANISYILNNQHKALAGDFGGQFFGTFKVWSKVNRWLQMWLTFIKSKSSRVTSQTFISLARYHAKSAGLIPADGSEREGDHLKHGSYSDAAVPPTPPGPQEGASGGGIHSEIKVSQVTNIDTFFFRAGFSLVTFIPMTMHWLELNEGRKSELETNGRQM